LKSTEGGHSFWAGPKGSVGQLLTALAREGAIVGTPAAIRLRRCYGQANSRQQALVSVSILQKPAISSVYIRNVGVELGDVNIFVLNGGGPPSALALIIYLRRTLLENSRASQSLYEVSHIQWSARKF
jgi:hypothetical protein